MKFFPLLILLSIFSKCNDFKKDDFCSSLDDENRELIVKVLSSKDKKIKEFYRPGEFIMINNGISDTLKTLKTFNISNQDTTYFFYRYSKDFQIIEQRKKVAHG